MTKQESLSNTPLLEHSRQTTLAALAQIDTNTLRQLSQLTLPEIQAIQQEIAQVLPAGNLPAFVLSGLLKLKGRLITAEQVNQDIHTLFRGLGLISQGLFGVFVAGPAAVLYAYQKLLQLAGKDVASAFPQGTWQFYLEFGLREDMARHANETVGFQRAAPASLQPPHAATAWVCAALELLYRYDDWLAADWQERVMLRVLSETAAEIGQADQPPWTTLISEWNKLRPYHRPPDGADYFIYREAVFQNFVRERLARLPDAIHKKCHERYRARIQELAAYQEQMSILAALTPDRFQERKEPIPLWRAAIAFIWQGQVYLLPACQRDEHGSPLCFPAEGAPIPLYASPDGGLCDAAQQPVVVDRSGRVFESSGRLLGRLRPHPPASIQNWLATLLTAPPEPLPLEPFDVVLVASPRSLQATLREKLPQSSQAELAALRCAPIIINWDAAPRELPLAYIRRGRRGVGDHALTIFRTESSFVFDQSHIFFDGMWGMAVAEILTDSAVYWSRFLSSQPIALQAQAPRPLTLASRPEVDALAAAPQTKDEVAAESDGIDTQRLRRARVWLAQRGVHLTVNDLLLLYRFFHALRYQPSPAVRRALAEFRKRAADQPEAESAYQSIEATLGRSRQTNPALLIPMDASNVSPQERIFPTLFRNPLPQISDKFALTQQRLLEYRAQPDAATWRSFDRTRRELLAYLRAFGQVLDALKAVTMRGESFNTATIRLLAHLPASMQHLLDQIPQRIGVLNEIIKGNEVFSNVGRVAPGASLTRFISAKDDGRSKELVWGILTDDEERMHISLRDFRPYVPALLALGEQALAQALADDYLSSYVKGFNRFIVELSAIITLKKP